MSKLDPQKHISELEAKILILERENEILAAKAEENLLLNKAFEEISSFNDLDYLLENTIESISILLDIEFSGVFKYENNRFDCLQAYSLINEDEETKYEIEFDAEFVSNSNMKIPNLFLEKQMKVNFINSDIDFNSVCTMAIPFTTEMTQNIYFIFSQREQCENLNTRLNLLNRVTEIVSSRLDRLFYQKELNKINNDLHRSNSNLKIKMEQLKEAQSKLIQSEKMASLGVLTAGIAHEINNPLNYILGAKVGLENYFEGKDDDEDVKFYLECINTGVERSSEIIKGLNHFSRNSEKYDENCNINEIINSCIAILNHKIKNKILLKKGFNAGEISIDGNVGKLHQVFINIINNAIQAIDEKGEILIRTMIINTRLLIEIRDTGCGMTEKEINKIFDPFYTTKEPGTGTGLGLSLSYSIVKEHDGSIKFESTPNKGTTVSLTFPLKNS